MIIEPKHFEYLVHQHGRVAHASDNFDQWKAAYEASLEATYESIASVLPVRCHSVLDVGSGLGGIDVHIARHYSDSPHIVLVDGDDPTPEVRSSFRTHSNKTVALSFLKRNYVNATYVTPEEFQASTGEYKFDLVVSFAAYGFHIHPGNYLDDLKKVIHDKTVIILEVRRTKEEWLRLFVEAFGNPVVLEREKKYVRVAFRA